MRAAERERERERVTSCLSLYLSIQARMNVRADVCAYVFARISTTIVLNHNEARREKLRRVAFIIYYQRDAPKSFLIVYN